MSTPIATDRTDSNEHDRPPAGVSGPRGWLATVVGGALGGIVGGVIGMVIGISLASDGLEGLFTMAVATCLGAVIGGGLGVTLLVSLRGHERPVASGVLFAIFYTLCAVGFFAAVATFTPDWDGQVWMTVVGLVSLVASALAARAIVTRRPPSAPRG